MIRSALLRSPRDLSKACVSHQTCLTLTRNVVSLPHLFHLSAPHTTQQPQLCRRVSTHARAVNTRNVMRGMKFRISNDTHIELTSVGRLIPRQIAELYRLLYFFTASGPRFTAAYLTHRREWADNPSSVPLQYRVFRDHWVPLWEQSIHEENVGILDYIDGDRLRFYCQYFGCDFLRGHESRPDVRHVHFGCFLLEVGVMLGDAHAAVNLINYCKDPEKAAILSAGGNVSTEEAWRILKERVTQQPELCDWEYISTYVDEEYSAKKMRQQSPAQLDWAIDLLQLAATKVPEGYKGLNPQYMADIPISPKHHPCRLLLRILNYCLQNNVRLPDRDLSQLRGDCLVDLVGLGDPYASMVIALNDNGLTFGSDDWLELLSNPILDLNDDACWLAAIAHAHKEGLLPVNTENREKMAESSTYRYAVFSIQAAVDQPQNMLPRVLALAALCRASGNHSLGLETLDTTLKLVDEDKGFPAKYLTMIEDHTLDYTEKSLSWKGYWTDKKINNLISVVFDPEACMKAARVNLNLKYRDIGGGAVSAG